MSKSDPGSCRTPLTCTSTGGRARAPPGLRSLPRRYASAAPRGRPRARRPVRDGAAGSRRGQPAGARALVPPARPGGDRAAAAPRLRERRARAAQPLDPRAADALGLLLVVGRDELQLAPAARAVAGAGDRRLARGLPPRRPRPFAGLLGTARAPAARPPRASALAAPLRGAAHALSAR